jgi:hypothetical protein
LTNTRWTLATWWQKASCQLWRRIRRVEIRRRQDVAGGERTVKAGGVVRTGVEGAIELRRRKSEDRSHLSRVRALIYSTVSLGDYESNKQKARPLVRPNQFPGCHHSKPSRNLTSKKESLCDSPRQLCHSSPPRTSASPVPSFQMPTLSQQHLQG